MVADLDLGENNIVSKNGIDVIIWQYYGNPGVASVVRSTMNHVTWCKETNHDYHMAKVHQMRFFFNALRQYEKTLYSQVSQQKSHHSTTPIHCWVYCQHELPILPPGNRLRRSTPKYYLVNTSVSHPFLPVTRRASNDHLTRKKLRHCPRQQPVWLARPPLISSFECIFLVFVIIMLLYIDKSQNDVCRWAYIMRMMKWNWRTNTTITNFVYQFFFVK